MNEPEINASKIPDYVRTLFHFRVLHEGWEMDNSAWVIELADGSRAIATTSHGSPAYIVRDAEMTEKVAEYEEVLAETRKALAMVEGGHND